MFFNMLKYVNSESVFNTLYIETWDYNRNSNNM